MFLSNRMFKYYFAFNVTFQWKISVKHQFLLVFVCIQQQRRRWESTQLHHTFETYVSEILRQHLLDDRYLPVERTHITTTTAINIQQNQKEQQQVNFLLSNVHRHTAVFANQLCWIENTFDASEKTLFYLLLIWIWIWM